MEGATLFASIVIIVFGILQIILFFKIWGMTNRVSSIERMLKSKKHGYEFYMLTGEKEKAYQLIKESLINKLIELRLETYGDDKFIALAEKEIPKYTRLMEYAGFEVPEYLSSAEAFNNYKKEMRSL